MKLKKKITEEQPISETENSEILNTKTPGNAVVDTKNSGVQSKSKIVSVSQKDGQDVANIEKSDTKMENSSTENIEQSVSQSIDRIFAKKKHEDANTRGNAESAEQILRAAEKSGKTKEVIAKIKNEEANAQANNTSIKIEDVRSEVKSDNMPTSVEAKTENVQADNNSSKKKDIPTETEVVDTTSDPALRKVAKMNESEVASVEVKSGDITTKEPEMVVQSKENVTLKNIVTEAQTEGPIPLIPDASKELNEVKGLTEKLSTTVKTIALVRDALGTVIKKQNGMQ